MTVPWIGWCHLFQAGLVVTAGRKVLKEAISAVPAQANDLPL